MSSIPVDALQFGGLSMSNSRVSYDKTRIAGSTKASYILHSKGGCMPGQEELFTNNSRSHPGAEAPIRGNKITNAFVRERYTEGQPVIGTKFPKTSNDNYTYQEYLPNDDDTLDLAIKASYRQVFGNFFLMESERPIELERRLRNGDIPIREFIRQLAKSPFYRSNYFDSVNQQRFIELSFKHLLGRPPISQEEVIKHVEMIYQEGFDYHIDYLIDSLEYEEAFGAFTVPYQRCWNSPCGSTTSNFVNTAALTRSFATSDNAIHGRKTSSDAVGGVSQLLQNLTSEESNPIIIPDNTQKIALKKTQSKQILDDESFSD